MVLNIGRYQINEVFLQIIIAALSLAVYTYLGNLGKLIVFPYVVYLVLKNDIRFFPALVLQLLLVNYTVYIILLACILNSIIHFKTLKNLGLGPVFVLYLLIGVYVIGHFAYRALFTDTTLLLLTSKYDFYLGLAPFFSSVVYIKTYNQNDFRKTFYGLLFVIILGLLFHVRISFYAVPFLFVYFIRELFYVNGGIIRKYHLEKILIFILLILLFREMGTFTLLFSSLLSLTVYIAYRKKIQFIIKYASSIAPYILIALLISTLINNYGEVFSENEVIAEKITVNNFLDRAVAKLVDDRVPFWRSGIKQIVHDKNVLMPIDIPLLDMEIESGAYIEVEIGAHNLYIEIIRGFGLLLGSLILFIYIFIYYKSSKLLHSKAIASEFLIFLSVGLTINTFGGIWGAYPLLVSFSLLNMGIMGFLYSLQFSELKSLA